MDTDQNKNQTGGMPAINMGDMGDSLLVKDIDGRLKVLSDGELKELDTLLESTAVQSPAAPMHTPSVALDFPKFTDIALVPADHHFQEPDKTGGADTKATLHFHPGDKVDLERELEKLNSIFQVGSQKQYSVDKIARKLADKHNLSLSPEGYTSFAKALLAFFRQIRSAVDLHDQLIQIGRASCRERV